jgi:hypothetical protein
VSVQAELFDAGLRHSRCLRCRRKLHSDKRRMYRTRLAGLCYECLKSFEAARTWQLELFLQGETNGIHHRSLRREG